MDWGSILGNAIRAFVGTDAVYFALAAIGLNVQFGYTGLLNFGQAAFMACGAYGLGMTAQYFGISFWWGLPIGLLYVVVLGLIVGIPTLRLRADYLAIVTIATAEIVRLVVRSVRFKEYFGGSDGINQFSQAYRDLSPFEPGATYGITPFRFTGYTLSTLLPGWILVAIVSAFVWSLMRSPWGRVVKAIREDEDAVRSLGKNVYLYKMQSLIIGGVFGVLAGMIFILPRAVVPSNYQTSLTFFIYAILLLGGAATVFGPIIGSVIFWVLLSFFSGFVARAVEVGWLPFLSNVQAGQLRFILVGIAIMLIVIYRPQGIFGNKKELAFVK